MTNSAESFKARETEPGYNAFEADATPNFSMASDVAHSFGTGRLGRVLESLALC